MCNSIRKGATYPIEAKGIGYKFMDRGGTISHYHGDEYHKDSEGWVNWEPIFGDKASKGFCFFVSFEDVRVWIKERGMTKYDYTENGGVLYQIEYEEGLCKREEPEMSGKPMIGLCHRFRILTSVDVAQLE